MRYGAMPELADELDAKLVRERLEQFGCDPIITTAPQTQARRQGLMRFLFSLKAGDELALSSFDALALRTVDLLRVLRSLAEIQVTVHLLNGQKLTTWSPEETHVSLLHALESFEAERTFAHRKIKRRRGDPGRDLELSTFQIKFARRMYDDGVSLREIGQLFQATPDEMWRVIGHL